MDVGAKLTLTVFFSLRSQPTFKVGFPTQTNLSGNIDSCRGLSPDATQSCQVDDEDELSHSCELKFPHDTANAQDTFILSY